MVNAKRNIAALYVKKVRKTRMEKRREKNCNLGNSYICHSCECPLSGAQKNEKISVLALSEIVRSGQMKAGKP